MRHSVESPCSAASNSNNNVINSCKAEVNLSVGDHGWIDYNGLTSSSSSNDDIVLRRTSDDDDDSNSTHSDPFKVVSSVFQTLLTLNGGSSSNSSSSDGPLLPLANVSAARHKCSYVLRAPAGHALRVGVESAPAKMEVRDDLFGREFSFLGLFGSAKSSVVETRGWVVTVGAEVRPGSDFRVNYQVIEPEF